MEYTNHDILTDVTNLTFLSGSASDVPKIMDIMQRSFSPVYGEAWNEQQCLSMLVPQINELFLISLKGSLVGFTITRTVLDEQELLMIAVDPLSHQKGIGRIIIEYLFESAVNRKITSIFLEVRENNPAQRLYEKMGFEKIGHRVDYYHGQNNQKYAAITYKKNL